MDIETLFSGWIFFTVLLFIVLNYIIESYILAKMSQVQFGKTHRWAFIPFVRMLTLIKLANSKTKSYAEYNDLTVIVLLVVVLFFPYVKLIFYYNILAMREVPYLLLLLLLCVISPIVFLMLLFPHRHKSVSQDYNQSPIYNILVK